MWYRRLDTFGTCLLRDQGDKKFTFMELTGMIRIHQRPPNTQVLGDYSTGRVAIDNYRMIKHYNTSFIIAAVPSSHAKSFSVCQTLQLTRSSVNAKFPDHRTYQLDNIKCCIFVYYTFTL